MACKMISPSSPTAQCLVLADSGGTSVSSRREGVWPWPNFHLGCVPFQTYLSLGHSVSHFGSTRTTHSFPILSHSAPRVSGVRGGCEDGRNHGYALPIFYTVPLTARRLSGISPPPSTTTSRSRNRHIHPKSVRVTPPAKTSGSKGCFFWDTCPTVQLSSVLTPRPRLPEYPLPVPPLFGCPSFRPESCPMAEGCWAPHFVPPGACSTRIRCTI